MLNVAIAILLTLFCFIFPNALRNAKDAAGNAKDWAKEKLVAGFNLGLGWPKSVLDGMKYLSIHVGGMWGAMKVESTHVGEKVLNPFKWTWRFLKCVGTCLGLAIPRPLL